MKKESVYISGIAGLLGSNISYLLKEKYHIYGIDRNKFLMPGVTAYQGDVLNYDLLKDSIVGSKSNYIIHCAALVNVDYCEENPKECYELNVELTRKIASIANEVGAKMIFISSDAVYNGDVKGLHKEIETISPISEYAKSKQMAEKVVLNSYNGLVIRTNILGYNYREKKSFNEWVEDSLTNGFSLNMFDDIYFSPITVNELAMIIDKCMDNSVSGLFNICSTGSISKYDIGNEIKKVFKLEGQINSISMNNFDFVAPRTRNMSMSNDKIKNELGIEISNCQETVQQLYNLRKNGYQEKMRGKTL